MHAARTCACIRGSGGYTAFTSTQQLHYRSTAALMCTSQQLVTIVSTAYSIVLVIDII